MKTKILFLFLSILAIIVANAQITKGNWMVGGSASFSSYKVVYDRPVIATVKLTSYNVIPKIGFFPIDKLALGLNLGYSYSKQVNKDANINTKTESYRFGPFVRYYYLNPVKNTNIFSEIGYNYDYSITSNSNSNNYQVSTGIAIFFNSSVAFEIAGKYYKFNDLSNGGNADDIRLEIGLQIHLEK